MKINVNSNEIVRYTRKLEKLGRSDFPVVVRQTLNTQAFQVKNKELIIEFSKAFVVRNRSFPKAFSSVEMAKGFDVKSMISKVGFNDRKRGGSSEQAGRDMNQQQRGGTIGGRKYIPIDNARVSKSPKKNIRKNSRMSSIRKIVDSSKNQAGSSKQRYVKSALYAATKYGPGSFLSHKGDNGKRTLYRIDRVGSSLKTRKLFIGVTPMYSVEEGRSVRVGPKPVTHRASLKVNKKVDSIFVKHAQKRFDKRMKK